MALASSVEQQRIALPVKSAMGTDVLRKRVLTSYVLVESVVIPRHYLASISVTQMGKTLVTVTNAKFARITNVSRNNPLVRHQMIVLVSKFVSVVGRVMRDVKPVAMPSSVKHPTFVATTFVRHHLAISPISTLTSTALPFALMRKIR
jgi:hypothetical protein